MQNNNEKPKTLKLLVHDMIIVEREVEVPAVCSKCKEEITKLTLWEYQDQQRTATVDTDGDLDWDRMLPKSGESYLYIDWYCGNCDSWNDLPLAKSTQRTLTADEAPAGIKDMLHIVESDEKVRR